MGSTQHFIQEPALSVQQIRNARVTQLPQSLVRLPLISLQLLHTKVLLANLLVSPHL